MAQNNYWMKLWFDILRDPKMGMLPDRLWRRVIELFLLAGQNGEDGLLPDVPTIAWQLNKSVQAINTDLQKIAEVGIIQETGDGRWIVINFKKRNEPVDPAKRIRDFRRRERYEKSNESVTEVKRECNEALQLRYQEEQKNRRTDLNTTTTPPLPPSEFERKIAGFCDIYAKQFGKQPKMDAGEPDKIIAMIQDGVTEEEFTVAIQEMDEKGFTCSGISSARNWIINNRSSKKRQPGNSSGRAKPDLGDYKISRLSEVVIE
jgi:hypothetical protein